MSTTTLMPIESFYRWLTFGETGASSKTIVHAVTGERPRHHSDSHPFDWDDMLRCLRLIEAVPEVRGHLHLVRALSPTWQRLIDNLAAIEATADAECPSWRTEDRPTFQWEGPLNRLVRSLVEATS